MRTWARFSLLAAAVLALAVPPAGAEAPPQSALGFEDEVVLTTPYFPTVLEIAPGGRVFVAQKDGTVLGWDDLSDPTPEVLVDLRERVNDYWDRGLLGMALDPAFPAQPYLYVLYTQDAPPGETPPYWHDACPTPPGQFADGCVVDGRLSRFVVLRGRVAGAADEKVLIDGNWCQQFPGHSVAGLEFGEDGALFASAGEGAKHALDIGQFGGTLPDTPTPLNPCGDPSGWPGPDMAPPLAEGGAMRAQDLVMAGDPVSFDGALLRVDPTTGAAWPTNLLVGGLYADDDRIVAHGFRNPFRFAPRPGTPEVWIGDVGDRDWEEIDVLADPETGVGNYGWPCYEGPGVSPGPFQVGLDVCTTLYSSGAAAAPYYAYEHHSTLGDPPCAGESASISAVAFYETGNYPAEYEGALFFADYVRECVFAMVPDQDGRPSPDDVRTVLADAHFPVDLTRGPEGDLFWVDIYDKQIHRLSYPSGNRAPVARITADVTNGPAPLSVALDGSTSSDPDSPGPLTYAWDLDGDGEHDDSTAPAPSAELPAGVYTLGLEVTDPALATGRATLAVQSGNSAPTAAIAAPLDGASWRSEVELAFEGSATDPDQGTLPASALTWTVLVDHCPEPDHCHEHVVQTFTGTASGVFPTPSHEYPSAIEIRLTATDAGGLADTAVVRLDAEPVTTRFETVPPGLTLQVGDLPRVAPFDHVSIVGSLGALIAFTPQWLDDGRYVFQQWEFGEVVVPVPVLVGTTPETETTVVARYAGPGSPIFANGFESGDYYGWTWVGGP